jgi:tetratricopeptide (TPR) repeat protein
MIPLSLGLFGAKALSKAITLVVGILVSIIFSYSQANAQTANFRDLMRQGDRENNNGRFNQASVLYAQAIKEQPKIWYPYAKRSAILFAQGRDEEARDGVNQWLALHPDAWAWYFHALLMQDDGKMSEAMADINRSCDLIRHSGKPPLRRAILRLLTGNFSGARQDSYFALHAAPTWLSAYEICSVSDALCGQQSESILNLSKYSFAKLHQGSELHISTQPTANIEDACTLTKSCINELLKRLSKTPAPLPVQQLNFAKALVAIYQENDAAVLKDLARQKIRTQVNLRLLRFYYFVLKRDFKHMDEDIHQLVHDNAKSDRVLDALDMYHFETGDRKLCISEIKKLIALDASNDAAFYELTKIYRDLGEPAEALEYCEKALHFRPKNEELLLIKSSLLMTLGKESEALKLLTDVLAQNKKCGQAFMMRASIYTHQANWSKAIESLSDAIDLNYDLIKALPARSACYSANHQDSLARRDVEELKTVDPRQWKTKLY